MDIITYNPAVNCYAAGNIDSWARANKLDIVLELHRNALNAQSNGYETVLDYRQRLIPAIMTLDAELNKLGWKPRGWKWANNGGLSLQNPRLMAWAGIPYALLELGFISNANDNAIYDRQLSKVGATIYKVMAESGIKRLGIVYGHGQGDPGACLKSRTEAGDVRNIVIANFKEEIELTAEQIRAIAREEITKALKPSERFIGTAPDHWAYKDWEELNETLRAQGVPELTSTNLQDPATRGEVIRMLNLISKVGCK